MSNLQEVIKDAQEAADESGVTQYVVTGYDERDNLDFVITDRLQYEDENYFAKYDPKRDAPGERFSNEPFRDLYGEEVMQILDEQASRKEVAGRW